MKRAITISLLTSALMLGTFTASAQAPPSDSAQAAPNPASQSHADANDSSKGQNLVGDSKPATANTLSAPTTTGQDKATGNNLVGDNKGQARNSGNERPEFKTLDVHNRGYLTADDVKSQGWLSDNFSRCNSKRDGHMTPQEYALCVN
jgi:hypothetical protein